MIDQENWEYPPFPPQRAVHFIRRYYDFELYWREQFVRAMERGVRFPSFGFLPFGTVQLALQSMLDVDISYPIWVAVQGSEPGVNDWLSLPRHLIGGDDRFLDVWNETAPVELHIDEQYRLWVLLSELWIQWAMFTLRVEEQIFNCANYRRRPGSGNFDSHPVRRYVYPGNPDWTP